MIAGAILIPFLAMALSGFATMAETSEHSRIPAVTIEIPFSSVHLFWSPGDLAPSDSRLR